jgi:ABC-type microcin C transport system permease subunit YejE
MTIASYILGIIGGAILGWFSGRKAQLWQAERKLTKLLRVYNNQEFLMSRIEAQGRRYYDPKMVAAITKTND